MKENNNMRRVFIGGLLSGVILNAISYFFNKFLLLDIYMKSPKVFMKPMDNIWFWKMVVFYFIVGSILAFAYDIFKHRVPGNGFVKGMIFGVLIWLAAFLPSMLFVYLIIALRAKLLLIWSINWFFNFIFAGAILGFIDEWKNLLAFFRRHSIIYNVLTIKIFV